MGNVLRILGNMIGILSMQRAGGMLTSSSAGSNPTRDGPDSNPITERPSYIEGLNDSVWELKEPEGSHEIDVIFFHGLQLNEDDLKNADWKTWLSRNGEVVWPKDWLGRKFPNSRIWSISYNSLAQTSSEMSLEQITGNLFQNIITFRNRDSRFGVAGQKCPVILVGHSLGGIIIKSLILRCIHEKGKLQHSRQRSESEHTVRQIDTFLDNCKGVFFYSSPLGGSKLADILKLIPGKGTRLVDLLKVFNAEANIVNEDFRQMREVGGLNIRTAAVYESRDTRYKGFHARVVEEGSARRDLDTFYTAKSADHIEVCKPCDQRDGIFQRLEDFILETCNTMENTHLTHDPAEMC